MTGFGERYKIEIHEDSDYMKPKGSAGSKALDGASSGSMELDPLDAGTTEQRRLMQAAISGEDHHTRGNSRLLDQDAWFSGW